MWLEKSNITFIAKLDNFGFFKNSALQLNR